MVKADFGFNIHYKTDIKMYINTSEYAFKITE